MNDRTIACAMLATLLLLAGPATAGDLQDHVPYRATAETFIAGIVHASHGAEAWVTAGSLDSRLRLARCDAALEAFQPSGSRMLGNTTVGVRCTGSMPGRFTCQSASACSATWWSRPVHWRAITC